MLTGSIKKYHIRIVGIIKYLHLEQTCLNRDTITLIMNMFIFTQKQYVFTQFVLVFIKVTYCF